VVFGIVIAMLVVAAIIALSVIVLVRTGGGRGKRVVGPAIPGDELTEHERDAAVANLTTLNQWETLREGQRSFRN
jgi:hypothetical protein